MNEVLTLLRPRLISLRNGGQAANKNARFAKFLLLAIVGVGFWGGLFAISWRVLYYFRGIEEIGDILGFKLLSMIFITSFALLIFSGILTSLSKLFLSRDLFLIHSLPISTYKLFTARWIDSTVDSSWMVIIYTLPVFIAYGIVYQAGPLFYITIFLTLLALAVTASAISTFLVICAVIVVPASRMKSIFVFLSILFFVILYISIRLLQPELLVDPEVFDSVLVYIASLKTSSSPFLPSTWAYDALEAALTGSTSGVLFHSALSWSFAGMMVVLIVLLADALYFKGFSKTQTAQIRLVKRATAFSRIFRFLPGPIKAFVEKDIKTFFRDQTQWSQLFLIAALVVIYIYNFNVLPLEKSPIKTIYLQNLLAFLNMGLALFVLTAITGRFAFPAVSAEKSAFWLVKSSPSPLKNFLWIKFVIYYLPLLILSEILIIATNILLNVTPFMMILSTVTVFFLVPGIVSMGIGLGAAYPDFKAENPAQTVTSYGGLIFMILCASFIGVVVIVEAGPVYKLFMADLHNRAITSLEWVSILGSFALAFIMSIAAILLPMKFGEKRLSKMLT